MKYAKKTLVLHGLAMAIGFGMLCASGLAQEAKPTASDATEELHLRDKIQEYKVDIEIGEPTSITDFLDLIHSQSPTPLNILVTRNTGSVMVSPMRLNKVSVYAALFAAVAATENEIEWNFVEGDEEVIGIMRNPNSYQPFGVKVINAAKILEDTEEASLLSAIEIGLEMRESSKKNVTIKLHKETKLLFVKGVAADVEIIEQIVSKLGGERSGGRTRSSGARARISGD